MSIARILDNVSSGWTARYKSENGDIGHILVQNDVGNKLIVETMMHPNVNIRNNHEYDLERGKITSVIKVTIPKYFVGLTKTKLEKKILESNDFEYIAYVPELYPKSGMIKGTIYNIAFTIQITLTPTKQIEEYIAPLQACMNVIEKVVQNIGKDAKTEIAQLLNQPKHIQTWRMAGLILSNAMVFYDMIADKITLENGKKCKTLDELKKNGSIMQKDLDSSWQDVLNYNYNPIFSIAKGILSILKEDESKEIIGALYTSSKKIRSRRMARSSDMYGKLLQKVIVDRDKLASYYTRPEAAALMAKLAVPEINHPIYSKNSITKYQIADFACGTGLLLSSAYRQLLFNYEASQITTKKIFVSNLHKILIEDCFIGLDVLPIATHLAVSSLAMMHPTIIFGRTKVKTMPIGLQHAENTYVKSRKTKKMIKKVIKHYKLGSLDLIDKMSATMTPSVKVVKGKEILDKNNKFWSIDESHHLISDGSCNLIVMNPPFVRATNHGGKHKKSAVPAWAAFNPSLEDQKNMGKNAGKKFKNTSAHGNAGLASFFIAICDRKISKNGSMILIVPATISNGESWNKARNLLKNGYIITVISIARPQITLKDNSFSSDTEMGEIILLAKKKSNDKSMRGLFISLHYRPQSILDAQQIANAIQNASGVDRLETGFGGTRLRIGTTRVGSMLDCPLEYAWPFVNVVDPFVEQIAYKIRCGIDSKYDFNTLGSSFKIGPHALDITGNNLRGPFKKYSNSGNPKYLALWNNKQKQQTKMTVPPDTMLKPKLKATNEHITEVWNTATHVHINLNPRYTSNSLISAYTENVTVGGSSWPSVLMDEKYEKSFIVWCNSTFGILCFWSLTGKQQLGRGRSSRTAILNLSIPDFTKMSGMDLGSLSNIYDRYHNDELDRIKNLWRDKTRMAIDAKIAKILEIDLDMNDIRVRLCMEPSISGGKPESILIKKHEEIIHDN